MWGYLSRRLPGVTAATNPELDRLAAYAVRYFQDEVLPTKKFRAPTDKERAALQDLHDQFAGKEALGAKELQDIVYAVGNAHSFDPLRDWFGAIYGVLLGADQGPRFGSFVALYGVNETRKLIADALAGKLVRAD
jgi:lysyl-tRNA synthetase class 1